MIMNSHAQYGCKFSAWAWNKGYIGLVNANILLRNMHRFSLTWINPCDVLKMLRSYCLIMWYLFFSNYMSFIPVIMFFFSYFFLFSNSGKGLRWLLFVCMCACITDVLCCACCYYLSWFELYQDTDQNICEY